MTTSGRNAWLRLSLSLALVCAAVANAAPPLEIERNPANGGLAAVRIAGDPSRMNWMEGHRTWGEIKRRPCTEGNLSEPYEVIVTRHLDGDTLHEEYLVTNTAPYDLFFARGDFGIYATFNDSYAAAGVCETNRCHAHVWCGGEVSWVQAKKMGPYPYELALVLREGALETYSVERFTHELSNDRGDFVLHPPAFRLRPHETMKIAWDLVAYEKGHFDETVRAHGGHVVRFRSFETLFPGEKFEIEADGETVFSAPAKEPYGEKVFPLEVGGKKTLARGFVSPPVEELVATRMRRMVAENQVRDVKSPLDGAFVIYDNEEKRPFFSYDNRDWNACRERIGMGVTLAKWSRLHPDAAWAREAVERFERFVLREVYDEGTGEVFDTIGKSPKYRRLYNAPWMLTFFLERYAATGEAKYLDRIAKTTRHYYAGGGWKFYPNGCTFADVLVALKKGGRCDADIEASVARHVRRLMEDGIRYPEHEVRFEQTIATPAVTIPLSYYLDIKRDPDVLEHVRECLDVLERFDGDQPDHRLGGVPIRHWDVRWFGKRMLLGDTFPHHWAVHSARAYALWARATGEATYRRKAERALRNALCAFRPDGTATCGYVYPFSVTMLKPDGSVESVRRGEFEDPWANDQDLALYFVMEYLGGTRDASTAPAFKRVYAFTDIGDDTYAAKLAELHVVAATCNGKNGRCDPEKLARAKKYGILPCLGFIPAGSHNQVLSPEEEHRQCEIMGRFLPPELKGDAREKAKRDLWRRQHYRMGGEPEAGNFEMLFEHGYSCVVGTNACAKRASSIVAALKKNPEVRAVSLDFIGYENYHGCYHPECQNLLYLWLKANGLGDTEANRDRFFEDQLVAYYNAIYDAVKAYDPSVVVYAHLYPVFLPNPLYGNRLRLDACCQTCAWYFRWPPEKVKDYCARVVRGQHDFWPFARGVPFVAYGKWVKGIDPEFAKTPEDIDRELRTALEAGAESLSVHEIKAVIDDPAVYEVFKKYCSPARRDR